MPPPGRYKKLRGYPKDNDDQEFMVIVEMLSTGKNFTRIFNPKIFFYPGIVTISPGFHPEGSWLDFNCMKESAVGLNNPQVIQCTAFPGRTVRVTRRPKALMVEQFDQKSRVASCIERLGLLKPNGKSNEKNKKKNKKNKKSEKFVFKTDKPVEC